MQSSDRPGDTPGDNAGDEYEVGYGKPPKHARFRAGRSGNPAGRRRGVRNLMTDVKRTLRVPLKAKESGRSRKISTQEGAPHAVARKGAPRGCAGSRPPP
jgi:Family of unknown function (DUF5681)